jgi:Holliday junction resolvasome RuvABC endonuclease subunit
MVMDYTKLTKRKAGRVIGIDCSTQSLAYAIFDNGKAVTCGEVFFNGSDVYERLNDARRKTQALVDTGVLVGDYVGMEAAIGGKSVQVTIKLSYVYGAVLSVLMQNKMQVHTVAPITWQTFIGNPNLKKDEKEKLREDNPDRKASWYQNEGRKLRKARTLDFARQFFTIPTNSDNVGDAVGVAFYVNEQLTRR